MFFKLCNYLFWSRTTTQVWRNTLLFLLVCPFGFAPVARASIDVGAGLSSITSSRQSLAITGSYATPGLSFSGFAAGVQTPLYYHSAYVFGVYRMMISDSFGWGAIRAGFGFGFLYGQRGLRDSPTATVIEEKTDFAIGPGFKITWDVMGPVFLNLEAIYGLRDPAVHALLSFQDVQVLSLGFKLW